MAGLFEGAQLGIDAIQQRTGLTEHAVCTHALAERVLVFGFEGLDRRIAFVELRMQFAQARIQLPALRAHPLQCLAQRGDLCPL
ncbi:hypothetical protein D3C71_1540720 [compost metagenome]